MVNVKMYPFAAVKRSHRCCSLPAVLLAAAALAACTANFPQPVQQPADIAASRWQVNRPDPSLVVIAPAADGSVRYLWTDALGLPLARQKLAAGRWQDDGLLPPNSAARPLFTALTLLGMPDSRRKMLYPNTVLVQQSDGTAASVGGKIFFRYACSAAEPDCRNSLHTLEVRGSSPYQIKQLP